jgi:hypothetical protein
LITLRISIDCYIDSMVPRSKFTAKRKSHNCYCEIWPKYYNYYIHRQSG